MFRRYVTLVSLLSCIVACSESSSRIEIPFHATFAGQPLSCASGADVKLTDIRFYVHQVRVFDANGGSHAVALDMNAWQQSNLAFLDLEDGSGSCLNGTAEMNAVVRGVTTSRDIRGLEFTLGVPFASNHGDPLKAEAPLGDADMHWHWRGGYKFLRAGIKSEDDSFWIHLGSTGCKGTIRNITGCSAPNRVVVRLDDFIPGDSVVIDLAELVSGDEFRDANPSDCSSGPAETACVNAFSAVGLDHATASENNDQRLFSVRRLP